MATQTEKGFIIPEYNDIPDIPGVIKSNAENTERLIAEIKTEIEDEARVAHTHTNKTVLDGISASDIDAWNGIKEQVTQTQLEEAIDAEAGARAEADNAISALLELYKAYFEDMCFSFTEEFQHVYAAMGVTVYDGGIFGMEQSDIALDGGDFTEETTGNVDCGGFEPLTAEVSAVVDGGEY